MPLKDFLSVLSDKMPFTIGTRQGQRWVSYYDGEHPIDIPDEIWEANIYKIYPREGYKPLRENGCCELKPGLGIIVYGDMQGKI